MSGNCTSRGSLCNCIPLRLDRSIFLGGPQQVCPKYYTRIHLARTSICPPKARTWGLLEPTQVPSLEETSWSLLKLASGKLVPQLSVNALSIGCPCYTQEILCRGPHEGAAKQTVKRLERQSPTMINTSIIMTTLWLSIHNACIIHERDPTATRINGQWWGWLTSDNQWRQLDE